MAASASGWLRPPDLSKRAVARRALQLLGAFLDEDQRDQAERFGAFAVPVENRIFWVPLEGSPWCAFADDGRVEHYCIAPDRRGGMPEGDVCLTYLLWITSDPDGFLREANVIQQKEIDWPDSHDELVRTLAELTKPAAPRPPRRPQKKRRRAHAPASQSEQEIREMFLRHGRTVPEEVLAVLVKA